MQRAKNKERILTSFWDCQTKRHSTQTQNAFHPSTPLLVSTKPCHLSVTATSIWANPSYLWLPTKRTAIQSRYLQKQILHSNLVNNWTDDHAITGRGSAVDEADGTAITFNTVVAVEDRSVGEGRGEEKHEQKKAEQKTHRFGEFSAPGGAKSNKKNDPGRSRKVVRKLWEIPNLKLHPEFSAPGERGAKKSLPGSHANWDSRG